jgi:hypothetical protein
VERTWAGLYHAGGSVQVRPDGHYVLHQLEVPRFMNFEVITLATLVMMMEEQTDESE